jgi:hypothetical protein
MRRTAPSPDFRHSAQKIAARRFQQKIRRRLPLGDGSDRLVFRAVPEGPQPEQPGKDEYCERPSREPTNSMSWRAPPAPPEHGELGCTPLVLAAKLGDAAMQLFIGEPRSAGISFAQLAFTVVVHGASS